MRTHYDVAVIGGGPGGSAVSTVLAKAGLDVVLVEGKRFPRFHLGESLLGASMSILTELGLAPLLAELEFLPKTGAVFLWNDTSRQIQLLMGERTAYQVRRDVFDLLLLQHAARSGVRVRQECWARDMLWDSGGRARGLVVQGSGEPQAEVTARMVIDASGLFQFLPRKLGLEQNAFGPQRFALSMYWHGARRPGEPNTNNIISEACEDGWLWFIPLSGDLTSVGFVGDAADFDGDAEPFMRRQIASSRLVRELGADADAEPRIRVLKYRNHSVGSPWWERGYLLVGDTAAFVDPLFSTGVHATLFSAMAAGAAVATSLRGGISEPEAAAWYEHCARRHYVKITEMIRLVYGMHHGASRFWQTRWLGGIDDQSAEIMMSRAGAEGMDFFVGAHLNGALDMPEPIARRLGEFRTRPRAAALSGAAPLSLAAEVERSADYKRVGSQLVRCSLLRHARNRTHEIRCVRGGHLDRVLDAIDGWRTLDELIAGAAVPASDAASVRRDLCALVDAGLLVTEPAEQHYAGCA